MRYIITAKQLKLHVDCLVRRNLFARFRFCLHVSYLSQDIGSRLFVYTPLYYRTLCFSYLPRLHSISTAIPRFVPSALGVYSTVFSYANNSYYSNASSLGFYSQTHFHFSGYWNSSRGVPYYVACPDHYSDFSTAVLQPARQP